MAKAKLNGIDVHYQIKGEGRDVVLIHGVTSTLAIWYMNVMPAFSAEFRVIAYDLRGHGYSEMTERGYTSREMADDLLALLDHLGLEKPLFVGHSFGGSIVSHLAALHPDRVGGFALADTGLACLRRLRAIENWPGWELYKEDLDKYGITYDWFVDAEGRDVNDVFRKTFEIPQQFGTRKGRSRATPRLRRLIDETRVGEEFRNIAGLTEERLAEIEAPVYSLYGETSPYRNMAEHLAGVMKNYRWEVVPGSGHFYLLDSVDFFVDRMLRFLRDPEGFVAAGAKQRRAAGNGRSAAAGA